jgi:thiosulfate/3-mercaptopyruvate sulfurtransferase
VHPTTLVEPALLAQRLADPSWAVIDCRFELARPDWGRAAYAQGHIPGALYAHLDEDLSGPVTPASGRHPLPTPEVLEETFGRLGIDESVEVIAYDQGSGAYAARLWWLLRWLGHRRVAVLDGGLAAWQQAGLPVSSAPAQRPARRFVARPAHGSWISTAALEQRLPQIAQGAAVLVDARGADRFRGENESIDPVAGHIPGARNHPYTANLGADGRFLPPQQLRQLWEQRLAGAAPGDLICMCGSGVTACHNLLALEVAGLPAATLYAGSWSEWIRDPARPVARGPQS